MNANATDAAGSLKLMTFCLAGQELGVDIMAVREIRVWTPPMPLPHMPEHVCGVINLRGEVLPIVDLSAQLGWGPTEPTRTHVVMVLSVGSQHQGVIVDAVSDILTVGPDELCPVPEGERYARQEVVRGIVTKDAHMITVLDLDKLPSCGIELDLAA